MSRQATPESSAPSSPLQPLHFLLGDWQALSAPDEPTGGFSFELRLAARVILRTNYADYPATAERAAVRHEDLMVIYLDEAEALRADYFDNEGHVLRYTGQVSAPQAVTFVSAPAAGSPSFRLAYRLSDPDILAGTFEIAPPHQPQIYSPYLQWQARRIRPADPA